MLGDIRTVADELGLNFFKEFGRYNQREVDYRIYDAFETDLDILLFHISLYKRFLKQSRGLPFNDVSNDLYKSDDKIREKIKKVNEESEDLLNLL